MKLGEKNFIFNLRQLNKDEPLTAYLFKASSRTKKLLHYFFGSWLIVIMISLFLLCGKIAAEDFAMFLIKVY